MIGSPSTSSACIKIDIGSSSFISCAPITVSTGASFTELTFKKKVSESDNQSSESLDKLSLTVTVILTVPLKFKLGSTIRNSPSIRIDISSDSLTAENINSESSTSFANKILLNITSSSVSCVPINVNTGASFTGRIVISNVSESVKKPSLTVTVIVTAPK